MPKRFEPALRLLPFALLLLAVTLRWVPGARTIDDSYITFRYVRNILAGNGFVYNPGEAVLGTTTPLYAFLLTGLGLFSGGPEAPFPQIALAVNALADGITCLLLFSLGRRLGSTAAGAGAALAWAVAPFSVTFAIGGLETSVYVLLLTGAIYAHLDNRPTLTALLGALSLLTRPDALILLGPLFLDRALQLLLRAFPALGARISKLHWPGRAAPAEAGGRTLPFSWREAAVFLIPVAAWLAFASYTFGSPIPHSIAAKTLAYRLPAEAAFVRLLQHFATPFMEELTFGVPAIAAGLVVYPFLFLVGGRAALQANPRIWPFLVYPWAYFAAFAIANPLIFRWYLTPVLPAYMLVILLGADRLVRTVLEKKEAGPQTHARRMVLPGLLLALLPALLLARGWSASPDHGLKRPAPEMAWYQLELLYQQAAERVSREIQAQGQVLPVLAAGDVGVLGYRTPARILDTVGLNSPQTLSYYPLDPQYYVINYAVAPDLILDELPDYIVILEVYGRAGLLKDPRFLQAYRLLETIPTDIYGSEGMLIFARAG